MHVLLVGGGGREHAIAWKLGQSTMVDRISWAPGNGGCEGLADRVPIKAEDVNELVRFATEERVDLVFVGPEVPLADGLSDELARRGTACFGPSRAAARIESSKVFSKEFCVRHGIPTAPFTVWDSAEAAIAYLREYEGPFPLVVKADGLAAGKGVLICGDREEALDAAVTVMVRKAFGSAGDLMLVESFLQGEEASLMVFCDGDAIVPMPPARDFKRVGDGDSGPNTGGMGAYCPSARMTQDQVEEALEVVVRPAVAGMAADGHPYKGVLYAGLMLTDQGPQVLEFNCRFGDPETQVVLPLLDGDLCEIAMACVRGDLPGCAVGWKDDAAATVVLCSEGYPGAYDKGKVISGLETASGTDGVVIFHAGTTIGAEGTVTSGGRVLNVTAVGRTVGEARNSAYAAAGRIHFDGCFSRKDIAGGV